VRPSWILWAALFWLGGRLGDGISTAWAAAVLGPALVAVLRARLAPAAAALLAGWLAAAQPPWTEVADAGPLLGRVAAVTLVGDRVRVEVIPDAAPDARVRVWQGARPPGLAAGARVAVDRPRRPYPPADNPGGYDPAQSAARDGVSRHARGPVRLLEPAPRWRQWMVERREDARAALAGLPSAEGAALLQGMLLGDRRAVPEPVVRAMRGTGTAHLLAVSGLHVGGAAWALALCVGWGARRLGAAEPSRWGLMAAAPVAGFVVAMAQFPLSACRAGLMVGLFVAGRLLRRRPDPMQLLGLAAVVTLATWPGAAGGPGFQLSFGAVAALLTLAHGERGLRGYLQASTVAALATAPILAWHFGVAAPLSPLCNLVFTPFASAVVVPLGVVGLVLEPAWSGPLAAAAWLAEWLSVGVVAFAEAGAGEWIVGAHAAPLAALPLLGWCAWRAGLRRWVPALGAAALLGTWALKPPSTVLDFVAVGQGDGILIRDGDHAALVDTGPDPKARALLGYLRHQGVGRLQVVAISHGHPDHYLGLEAVLEALPVGVVLHNGRPPEHSRAWRRAVAVARARGVPVEQARPGPLKLGDLKLTVMLARAPADAHENDASVVLRVDGPGGSALLPGDLESAGEARLVAAEPGPVTVLKAPHHGSRTSSGTALLDAVCPKAVVFTAGRDNRYGFPHPQVLARLTQRGVPAWGTHDAGRVRLRFDAEGLSWSALRRAEEGLPRAGCPGVASSTQAAP
jgi:competence protein ComEC